MNKKRQAVMVFEEKKGKSGQCFMQGIGDHKDWFLFIDQYQTKKLGRKIWRLDKNTIN